jgi:hypothetical protein
MIDTQSEPTLPQHWHSTIEARVVSVKSERRLLLLSWPRGRVPTQNATAHMTAQRATELRAI